MPPVLGLLLSVAVSDPGTFSVVLVPPPRLRPAPASVELHYRATRKIPFLSSSVEWNLLGGYLSLEAHRKDVVVKLRERDGLLVTDGLEREAGGLGAWTLEHLTIRYGPYSVGMSRIREAHQDPPKVMEVDRTLERLRLPGWELWEGVGRVRVTFDGEVPGPLADGLPKGAGGLAELALPPGREVEAPLRNAFRDQDWGVASEEVSTWRMETALIEERDVPAEPVLTREQWDALRARQAARPALTVAWGFVPTKDGRRVPHLGVRADGQVAPVVLLVASYLEVHREVRPAVVRLVPE